MTQDLSAPDEIGAAPGEAAPGDDLPLYLQVASTLRTAILRGIYPVGSRLPTEDELCQRFKVSRHTIREALRQLRTDHLITSRPGSRPIVAPPMSRRSEVIAGDIGRDFFDYTIGTRLEIESKDVMALSAAAAEAIGMAAGKPWLHVGGYRIGIDDGRHTCWNQYYICADYALVGRLLARHVGPLIPLLEDLFDDRITRITRAISAVAMPAERAAQLRCAPGSAALAIVTRCEIASGKVVMLNRSIHPGGTISYAIRR